MVLLYVVKLGLGTQNVGIQFWGIYAKKPNNVQFSHHLMIKYGGNAA